MLWGAIAQTIPDLDVFSRFWLDTPQSLLAHRGFTHSFLFVLLASPFLAGLCKGLSRNPSMSLLRWMALFAVELSVHNLVDSLTTYGTAWLEPFSHYRISFDVIFVADPFYTIALLIAAVVLVFLRSESQQRLQWVAFGLVTSTLYLLYCFTNKSTLNGIAGRELSRQQIPYTRYVTTPTPLNNWLWYVIAETETGFYTGYHSVFDKSEAATYQYFPRNDSLIAGSEDHSEVNYLKRFSQGYYTVENRNDTLIFNDLRFGQVAGWANPQSHFVFYYYLENDEANKMVVQRGRFEDVEKDAFRSLVNRICSN